MTNIDYFETWKEVMKKPSDFYREMPKAGGYFNPVIFAISSISIMLFFTLLTYPLIYPEIGNTTNLTYIEMPLVLLIIFLGFIVSLFMNAAILYITYKALGGKGSYEGTVGLVCYATAALVLGWIPLIGWIFGGYQTYLYIVGGRFVHDMSMGRSIIALVMSSLLIVVFVVIISLSGFV